MKDECGGDPPQQSFRKQPENETGKQGICNTNAKERIRG
jgi:hypothetical protein